MKKTVILALFMGFVMIGAEAAESDVLSGEALRKTVAGKTVYLRTQGVEVPIQYRTNGTMSGRLRALAAAFGRGPSADRGRWWISNGRLCQKWSRWLDGKPYCYALKRAGTQVHWQRNDGRRGTARISG